jgi:hypothetical protein
VRKQIYDYILWGNRLWLSCHLHLKDNQVSIDADGLHYGKCMTLNLVSRVDSALFIFIENGLMLMCDDTTTQDMIITKPIYVNLEPRQQKEVQLYAMCSEIHDGAPNIFTDYNIGSIADKNLVSIANSIDEMLMNNVAGQGAIWAYTDQAEEAALRNYGATDNSLNLTIEIFDCDRGEFEGLLGNANGIIEDDFNGRNSSRQRPVYASFSSFGNPMLQQASANAEREYLNFLARDFAEDWRVTDQTTLFDYAIGLTTATYTDRSFPREHFTVSDLPTDRRNASRKKCEDMGISADEMPGCIFDNGFLNLNPSPIPETNNPTRGTVLKSINKPALNNNFATFDENINSTNPLPIVEPIKSKEYNQPIIKDEEPKSIENRPREYIAPNYSFEIKSPKLNKTPNNSISTPNKPSPNEPVQKPSLNGGSIKTKKGK